MGNRGTQLIAGWREAVASIAVPGDADRRHAGAGARQSTSGKECVPALLVLGSFLEYFAGRTADPDRVYLLFMPMTTGPCRTGQYAIYYQNLFQELGHRNIAVLSPNSDNSYRELGPDFNRRAWLAIVLADRLKDIDYSASATSQSTRRRRARRSRASGATSSTPPTGAPTRDGGPRGLESHRLARIPLARRLADAPKRSWSSARSSCVRTTSRSTRSSAPSREHGIVPHVRGLAEWMHYLDWQQRRRLRGALSSMPLWKRAGAPGLRKYATLKVEMAWKRLDGAASPAAASPASGLVTTAPHDMDVVMSAVDTFASPDLDSEAILSPCAARLAVEDGFNGVAVIAPFACLPGRVIEALFAPWARARGVPVICLENDGNQYAANVMSRLEVFATQASRGNGRR